MAVGDKYEITEEGIQIVQKLNKLPPPEQVANTPKPEPSKIVIEDLLVELRAILKKHTGNTQAYGFGGRMPFLPSSRDLTDTLMLFKRRYQKIWDADKVKRLILEHAEKCAKSESFVPTIKNYIYTEKNGVGTSSLAAFIEQGEGKRTENNFDIIETKNLFE